MFAENPNTAGQENVIDITPFFEGQAPKLKASKAPAEIQCFVPELKSTETHEALYPNRQTTAERIKTTMKPSIMAQVFSGKIHATM